MVDIFQASNGYEVICKEKGIPQHPTVKAILSIDRDQAVVYARSTGTLYLAGNNNVVVEKRFSDEDVKQLCIWLQVDKYFTDLDLRYNQITDEGVRALSQYLAHNGQLKSLNLMCNDFGEEGALHLSTALQDNSTLINLRLNGNKIGNKGGLYFAQALQVNKTLESLDLSDTDLKTESLIALSTVLISNCSLRAINVSRPLLFSLQEETNGHFARMLKVNKRLEEIHLMKCDMRDFGATRISENLMDNFTLTYLNLSCNRITRDGAKEIAELLKRDTSLSALDLSYNRVGDDGLTFISEALATYNTNLKTLSVVSNEVGGKGLVSFSTCMRSNTSLQEVFLWGNNFEESGCIAIKHLLESGRFDAESVDVKPYEVDGRILMAQVTNGLRCWYYWRPTRGLYADPQLTKCVQFYDQKYDVDLQL